MKNSIKVSIAAAAISGLLLGVSARAAQSVPTTEQKQSIQKFVDAGVKGFVADDKSDKHDCAGKNDCKNKGGCKTGDAGCKGKNTCKGKGGCKVADSKMLDAGVRAVSFLADTDKHDCAGKNDCKNKGGCKTGDAGCKGKNTCKGKGGCKVGDAK